MFQRTLILVILLSVSSAIMGQTLERRAFLGVQVAPLNEEQWQLTESGVRIVQVFADSTASEFGLRAEQIILRANGQRLDLPADLPAALQGLRSGAEVEFEFLSDGETVSRRLVLREFPREQMGGAELTYGSIATDNGLQRTILSRPRGIENPPVVYILPGFGCSSMDLALNPDTSITRLLDELTNRGFATYRVEKSGLGDSIGTLCQETGFDNEAAGYLQGLHELVSMAGIDRHRIYLLGISLGGVWAPMLASQVDVAGIISFSTIAKTWVEYMADNWRRQWELAGKSFSAIDADLKLAVSFWDKLLAEDLSPAQIFDRYPQLATLQGALAYEPENANLLGRHYTFVKELANTNIASNWEQVDAPTLLLWGLGDYVATEEDQRLIQRTLTNRDIEAELIVVESDHFWRQASDFRTAYDNMRQGTRAPLQATVYETIVNWLESTG